MIEPVRPVILFRASAGGGEEERAIAAKYFRVVSLRTEVKPGELVIPRYSALPIRHELVGDIKNLGATLANSQRGHSWIADMDWRHDLKLFTPRTWDENEFPSCDHQGPFVVKGKTNSRKNSWLTRMFAKDRQAAVRVVGELLQDPEIVEQGIVYREFVPLRTFETDFTGLPVSNEWRFVFWRTTLLAHGFYWSTGSDEAKARAKLAFSNQATRLARQAARIAAEHVTFFVIDVAEKAVSGGPLDPHPRGNLGWTVIEVNSGEQAGLSEIDPDTFYAALREAVDREPILDLCDQCGIPEGDAHWARAGGDCLCDFCGEEFKRHPMDETHEGINGALWLHRLCDGSLVKT